MRAALGAGWKRAAVAAAVGGGVVGGWYAVGAPRVRELQSLQPYDGSGQPMTTLRWWEGLALEVTVGLAGSSAGTAHERALTRVLGVGASRATATAYVDAGGVRLLLSTLAAAGADVLAGRQLDDAAAADVAAVANAITRLAGLYEPRAAPPPSSAAPPPPPHVLHALSPHHWAIIAALLHHTRRRSAAAAADGGDDDTAQPTSPLPEARAAAALLEGAAAGMDGAPAGLLPPQLQQQQSNSTPPLYWQAAVSGPGWESGGTTPSPAPTSRDAHTTSVRAGAGDATEEGTAMMRCGGAPHLAAASLLATASSAAAGSYAPGTVGLRALAAAAPAHAEPASHAASRLLPLHVAATELRSGTTVRGRGDPGLEAYAAAFAAAAASDGSRSALQGVGSTGAVAGRLGDMGAVAATCLVLDAASPRRAADDGAAWDRAAALARGAAALWASPPAPGCSDWRPAWASRTLPLLRLYGSSLVDWRDASTRAPILPAGDAQRAPAAVRSVDATLAAVLSCVAAVGDALGPAHHTAWLAAMTARPLSQHAPLLAPPPATLAQASGAHGGMADVSRSLFAPAPGRAASRDVAGAPAASPWVPRPHTRESDVSATAFLVEDELGMMVSAASGVREQLGNVNPVASVAQALQRSFHASLAFVLPNATPAPAAAQSQAAPAAASSAVVPPLAPPPPPPGVGPRASRLTLCEDRLAGYAREAAAWPSFVAMALAVLRNHGGHVGAPTAAAEAATALLTPLLATGDTATCCSALHPCTADCNTQHAIAQEWLTSALHAALQYGDLTDGARVAAAREYSRWFLRHAEEAVAVAAAATRSPAGAAADKWGGGWQPPAALPLQLVPPYVARSATNAVDASAGEGRLPPLGHDMYTTATPALLTCRRSASAAAPTGGLPAPSSTPSAPPPPSPATDIHTLKALAYVAAVGDAGAPREESERHDAAHTLATTLLADQRLDVPLAFLLRTWMRRAAVIRAHAGGSHDDNGDGEERTPPPLSVVTRADYHTCVGVLRQVARLVSNLAAPPAHGAGRPPLAAGACARLAALDGAMLPLRATHMGDAKVECHTARAAANIAAATAVQGAGAPRQQQPVYGDMLYPCYVPPPSQVGVPVDIIVLHGLQGAVLKTWRAGEGAAAQPPPPPPFAVTVSKEGMQLPLWPVAWLARDLTGAGYAPRVLAVSYDAHMWSTSSIRPLVPLPSLGATLAHQLRCAGVGAPGRATVVLAHSMGGLLTKAVVVADAEAAAAAAGGGSGGGGGGGGQRGGRRRCGPASAWP